MRCCTRTGIAYLPLQQVQNDRFYQTFSQKSKFLYEKYIQNVVVYYSCVEPPTPPEGKLNKHEILTSINRCVSVIRSCVPQFTGNSPVADRPRCILERDSNYSSNFFICLRTISETFGKTGLVVFEYITVHISYKHETVAFFLYKCLSNITNLTLIRFCYFTKMNHL